MHPIQEKILVLAKKLNLKDKSLREIGELVGCVGAPQKIKHHLQQLEKKGFIQFLGEGNAIRRLGDNLKKVGALISVPILGAANCGEANLFADDNVDGYLKVSPGLLKKKDNIFAIRASGFSMNRASVNGEAIDEGDYVIVDSENKNPSNGDYVLSIIDGVANIKKFSLDKGRETIILSSESSKDYPPIYIHRDDAQYYHIGGRIMQVIKKPA